ncbi:MAG: hypothetical protein LBJ41_09355 [Treponema sp.]|jgi:ABC-type oligopeptide transport system substrate-binding subunit|nr:hypothetical protein [Treponema sp.]
MYNQSITAGDNAKHIALLHAAERLIIKEDSGIIPLYYSVNPSLFRDSVRANVHYDANDKIMLTDSIVKKQSSPALIISR